MAQEKCSPSPFADGRCALHGASFPEYDDDSGLSRYCLVDQIETCRYLAQSARDRAERTRLAALEADAVAARLDEKVAGFAAMLAAEQSAE